ncbi:electron transfer flavoprotein-ubiquinone oxidoreductase [bacterium]|mgnify:FL=1|jgi:electron-transferring-flavoprotein dehydrogenase|nr:electron transfer flavoprotein-ubiquinone oxidoreductase [Porticoccaceae bacterium]MDB4077020.1 electron transfer flavoprotein-ubiquinone oxidoreductase [Porticoccaceae bacterium]MDB4321992.1 electron transfer flavoprotein-ubiquinone oxidoreductase [bacterium]MDB9951988.1 electron transfer flavoprotein-ubiquinone oxidoreductase [Porticoccaceae bacterium]MDC0003624.1 electron transfer flavoprotein-ubiquinone oxidoreductase [Porticoccaceae bacterium]
MSLEREFMDYDVVIVGAGPSGLAAACRLKQVNADISVCVVEKGSEVGAHILSGAVFEPTPLNELFPDWKEMGAPLLTPVTDDKIFVFTGATKRIKVPNLFAPKTMHNHGNYIISLGKLCRWLAEQAENLGVDIFPGFAAAEVLYGDNNEVLGIATGDMGVGHNGEQKGSYQPGMELRGKYTLFSEGCRGNLGKEIIAKYALDAGKDPQHYGLGIKELWKIPAEQHQPGLVVHSAGWPLDESKSLGGGFLYHLEDNTVAVGLITNLSYTNPHLSPFDEFQRYKHHPEIAKYLQGGERLTYGARALLKGGLQSQPKMSFPGGILVGDDAGTLNFAKIKGSHTAMKSGMVAAETVAEALAADKSNDDLESYAAAYKASWAYKELHMQRNFGPAQHKFGNIIGSAYAFIDINIFNGMLPWTLSDKIADHETLLPASECKKIDYPKHDGKLSFDKSSSVFMSNTNHEEDQPCHLVLADPDMPINKNLELYDEPAQRYCPAGVYEVVANDDGSQRFQINSQNCVHCKTCDIKEPSQNINWVVPEGSGGPNYPAM